MVSESFQTAPVIFKTIRVQGVGTITEMTEETIHEDIKFLSVWFNVRAACKHFEGGSNGTSLFNVSFEVFENESINKYRLR